ncbi:MAG: dihydrofolate reductase [Parcubacteria group bacterium]|nr:dihydrofolate reductase [Parcubacteria group bacterium]
MIISIIAAIGNNNIIGANNSLPWNLPADMQHFQEFTRNKPIIMGLKTFESIGKPLPQRDNIILTRDADYKAPGCKLANSINHAIELAKQCEMGKTSGEVMICGGASVYKQFLPLADKMYLTYIDADFTGDTFFPDFDKSIWKETERQDNKADDINPYDYSFITLEKRQ